MLTRMYAVKDLKVDGMPLPSPAPSDGVAMRSFRDAVNGGDPTFSSHPEDFILYYVGSWDHEAGEYVDQNAFPLVKAIDLVEMEQDA